MKQEGSEYRKSELVKKIIHEELCERDVADYVNYFSDDEKCMIKIITGDRFFKNGDRLIFMEKEIAGVENEINIWLKKSTEELRDSVEERQNVIKQKRIQTTHQKDSHDRRFDGINCCDWARIRFLCRAPWICGCWGVQGGWKCATPSYHGNHHGSCRNKPYCKCYCGHEADWHEIMA